MTEFKTTELNGLTIRYLDINESARPVILFLHGWGGSLDSWQNFLNQFEGENIRVLAFDLPGFGQSPAPVCPWTVNDYSLLVNDFLEQLELNRIYLFGHSFGGQIAVRFAHDYPAKVGKLFLSGAAVIRPNKSLFKILLAGLAKIFKIILLGKAERLRQLFYRLIGAADYGNLTDPVMRQTMQNVIRDDLSQLLPNLKMPVFLIWGKKDKYTPFSHFLQIKKILPNAQAKVFADARHGLHWQKPSELKVFILTNL